MLLVILAGFEIVFNKAKRRHTGIFFTVLVSLFVAVSFVATLGVRFALQQVPFYEPSKFIPVVGMLLGNSVAGVAIASNYITDEIMNGKAKLELWLAMGATRWEVGTMFLLKPALKMALLPVISQMRYIYKKKHY